MSAAGKSVGPLPLPRAVGALALLTSVFLLNFASRVILAPLMTAVEADLGIGHGQAGSLFLMISLGYCAGLLGAGFVCSWLVHYRVIALSAVGIGAVLFALSKGGSLWELRLALVLVGVASGLYLPSAVATITSLVAPGDWGKALAIHELAPNLGYMLSPVIAEAFLHWASWRAALAVLGVAGVAAGAAYLRFGRGGRFRGEPPSWSALGALVTKPAFTIMVALLGLGLGSSMGVYAMLPLYLTSDLGFSRGWANGLLAVSRISGLLTVFASGWLSDRLGAHRALVAVLTAGGFVTALLGVAGRSWVVPVVLLQSMLTAWFFPAAFAILSRISPLAVSFTVPLAVVLGGGVIPTLIGILGERGWFGGAIASVGVLMLGGAALATRLESQPGERPAAAGVRVRGEE